MRLSCRAWTDEQVETIVGALLRGGVLLAAAVVLIGAGVYLRKYGGTTPDYRMFRGEPEDLRSISGIISAALALRGRGLIQLGLLLLIATPVARVVFSAVAFACQRDYTYVTITLIVLALLLYSLTGWHP
ncbi:MAG TPA: DUF1634 domain-containing protein [Candidatus Binatia bacterium]|nr:DUF1634 domain-containing protein [Candidatus Binatia bacterium]